MLFFERTKVILIFGSNDVVSAPSGEILSLSHPFSKMFLSIRNVLERVLVLICLLRTFSVVYSPILVDYDTFAQHE